MFGAPIVGKITGAVPKAELIFEVQNHVLDDFKKSLASGKINIIDFGNILSMKVKMGPWYNGRINNGWESAVQTVLSNWGEASPLLDYGARQMMNAIRSAQSSV